MLLNLQEKDKSIIVYAEILFCIHTNTLKLIQFGNVKIKIISKKFIST